MKHCANSSVESEKEERHDDEVVGHGIGGEDGRVEALFHTQHQWSL